MSDKEDLTTALADLRYAFRLVYGYQRRINDLFQRVELSLKDTGLRFHQWGPMQTARVPKSDTPFFRPGKWAWDLLPGYAIQAFWQDESPRRGHSRQLLLQAVADDGRVYKGEEPNPLHFTAVSESGSFLRIGMLSCNGQKKASFAEAYSEASRLKRNEQLMWELTLPADGQLYRYRYIDIPMEELITEEAERRLLIDPILAWSEQSLQD